MTYYKANEYISILAKLYDILELFDIYFTVEADTIDYKLICYHNQLSDSCSKLYYVIPFVELDTIIDLNSYLRITTMKIIDMYIKFYLGEI